MLRRSISILPQGRVNKDRLTNPLRLAPLIQQALDITAHSTRPLIDKRIPRLVVQHTRNRHTLLLATTQHVLPVLARIPPALAVRQVAQLRLLKHAVQFELAAARVAHIELRVRVDDLIAQRARAEIRPLREEHDAVHAVLARPRNEAAVCRP